jgi:hypothetical protein
VATTCSLFSAPREQFDRTVSQCWPVKPYCTFAEVVPQSWQDAIRSKIKTPLRVSLLASKCTLADPTAVLGFV